MNGVWLSSIFRPKQQHQNTTESLYIQQHWIYEKLPNIYFMRTYNGWIGWKDLIKYPVIITSVVLPCLSVSAVADSNPKSIGHLLWTFDVLWASLGEAKSHVLRHIRIFWLWQSEPTSAPIWVGRPTGEGQVHYPCLLHPHPFTWI